MIKKSNLGKFGREVRNMETELLSKLSRNLEKEIYKL